MCANEHRVANEKDNVNADANVDANAKANINTNVSININIKANADAIVNTNANSDTKVYAAKDSCPTARRKAFSGRRVSSEEQDQRNRPNQLGRPVQPDESGRAYEARWRRSRRCRPVRRGPYVRWRTDSPTSVSHDLFFWNAVQMLGTLCSTVITLPRSTLLRGW